MSLDAILRRQSGMITREQAIAAGLSRDDVDERIRLRRWRPLHPRVYLAAGHRHDAEVTVRAAMLWAGEGAVLTGLAAAWWHGLVATLPPSIGVAVPRRRQSRPDVRVRYREVAAEDRVIHRGLAVTGLPLTALDAAVELGSAGAELLDIALQRRVPFSQVREAHARNPGSASAGRLLAAAADRSAAATKRLLVRALTDSGAAGWLCDLPVAGCVVDIAFPAARVALDPVGWAWHTDAAHARRHDALAGTGWTILRCTWHELVASPRAALARIAAEVARRMQRSA
jgi:very-short-patch-repair endonuclease